MTKLSPTEYFDKISAKELKEKLQNDFKRVSSGVLMEINTKTVNHQITKIFNTFQPTGHVPADNKKDAL